MSSASERLNTAFYEIDMPLTRRQRRLGARVLLDGFIIMDEARSPYEDVKVAMKDRIVEQPEAIDSIIEALDRSEVRLEGDNRPIANLAFLGPTGVGKSEAAKALAEQLGPEANLIKIDCSNYSSGHEVASLTGSPPGYVGHEQEPLLSKERVEQAGTVVLFDEIEKGSSKLYNLMLQVMGDGELQLNDGDVTNFRDTVVVLTSNLGAKEMSAQLNGRPLGFGEGQQTTDREGLTRLAKRSFAEFFSPEFTNRLNKMVVFHPLSNEGLGRVLDVKMAEVNEEYEKAYGVRLSLSDATRSQLVDIATEEPHLGARPLVRAFEDNVQSVFGRYAGLQKIINGTHVRVFHRSEVPEDYPLSSDREFVFAAKPDETLLPKPQALKKEMSKELVLLMPDTVQPKFLSGVPRI